MHKFLHYMLLLTSLSCLSQRINAEEINLSIDKYYSPYTGSDLLLSGLRVYQTADDIWLSSTEGNSCAPMVLARMGKFSLEWVLANLAMVTQHEVFGHGARAREFDLANVSYHVDFWHGATYFSRAGNSQLHINQKAALAAGGMEGTSILAKQLQTSWMNGNNTIDSREASMYLVNSLDQSRYVFGTSRNSFSADNDVVSYMNHVNSWHGSHVLNTINLRRKIVWDLLDPMLYYSILSLYNYIWQGESKTSFSTLSMGSASFMPTTRTLLTPWGPELQLLNHFRTADNKYLGVHLRTGRTGGTMSHGVDLHVNPIAEFENLSFNNKLAVWYQPHILKATTAATNSNKFGFAEFFGAAYRVNRSVYSIAEIGFKTSGYLPGTPLTKNLIWRLGFKFNLDAGCKS